MWTIIAIIIGIWMLMTLVIIHELGHFWAAKKMWVKVLEFGVWIPPKATTLWTDKDGTSYTLNRIPLWGFVRLKGENPDDEEEFLANDSLITATLWSKIVILLAGITMNFIATYLIFVVVFMVGVTPLSIVPDTSISNASYLSPTVASLQSKWYTDGDITQQAAIVQDVLSSSRAQQQWIVSWDRIVSVWWVSMWLYDILMNLSQLSGSLQLGVEKADWTVVSYGYICSDTPCQLWVSFARPLFNRVQLGHQAWWAAWSELTYQSSAMMRGLGRIGASLISFDAQTTANGLKMMSGPAGVIKIGQDIINTRGRSAYLAFAWLISLSLALFNLLPIPALDGGRVVWSIIQVVGRFKPQKYFVIENYINMFFFIALMALWIYVLWQDLVRAWGLFGG